MKEKDRYQVVELLSRSEAMKSKDNIPLTVGSLKAWLEQFPDNVSIEIMTKVLDARSDNCMIPIAACYKNKKELVTIVVLTKREDMEKPL